MSDDSHVEIPMDRLSEDALLGIVDDYILREGTDYGRVEVPLAIKREHVLSQLRAGTAAIVFDPATETCTIMPRRP